MLKKLEEEVTIQIIQLLANARTSRSQIGRKGSLMRRIHTSAEASELQADYRLTVPALRRNPDGFRLKNISVEEQKKRATIQSHLFYIEGTDAAKMGGGS